MTTPAVIETQNIPHEAGGMDAASAVAAEAQGMPEGASATALSGAPEVLTAPKVPAPLLPYQQRWNRDDSPLKLNEKSRRIGITYGEASDIAASRLSGRRNEDYWFSSADESAAVEMTEYVAWWCKSLGKTVEIITGQEEDQEGKFNTLQVRFPSGKRFTAMTSNPRRFRSKGGDVGLDEFAFHEQAEEMLKAATPVTTWGGHLHIFSSHNGEQSVFNRLCQMGHRRTAGTPKPGDMPFSLHRITLLDAVSEGLVEQINRSKGTHYTHEEFIASCRSKCLDEDAWNQEYMCIPSAESTAYLPYSLINTCLQRIAPMPTEDLGQFLQDIATFASGASTITVGVDIGRKRDRFVMWVLAKFGDTRQTAGILRWQNRTFPEMRAAVKAVMVMISPRIRRMCIDATGLGMELAEWATKEWRSRAEAVTFTAQVKADLAPSVRVACEERSIGIPDDVTTKDDLHSIRKVVTSAGNIRYAGERSIDGHADMFWALALALHAGDNSGATARLVEVPADW